MTPQVLLRLREEQGDEAIQGQRQAAAGLGGLYRESRQPACLVTIGNVLSTTKTTTTTVSLPLH
ncbi:MAG: hypothetical protein AB1568_16080 [Thermodesulfobacteriota bacterium]